MRLYNFRFLDRLDFIILSKTVVSDDDLSALEEAKRWCGTHTIEIWEGERRVARVKKGNAALTSEDRICGQPHNAVTQLNEIGHFHEPVRYASGHSKRDIAVGYWKAIRQLAADRL